MDALRSIEHIQVPLVQSIVRHIRSHEWVLPSYHKDVAEKVPLGVAHLGFMAIVFWDLLHVGTRAPGFWLGTASGIVATSRAGLASAPRRAVGLREELREEVRRREIADEVSKAPRSALRRKEHRLICFSLCSKADPDVAEMAKVRKIQDLAAFISVGGRSEISGVIYDVGST